MDDILKNLNRFFDHTNLKQDAVESDIALLCQEAVEYEFYAVCVNPVYVQFAREQLSGTHLKLVSVCSFPLGATGMSFTALIST